MCQISVVNLKSSVLNRKAFLLAGSFGSTTNDDGWGFGDINGIHKSPYPMFLENSVGEYLRVIKTTSPLLGHVRAASARVPVCSQNSHPFLLDNIIFMHNGSLTPKNEKDFELEYEVEEEEGKDKKIVKRKYKHSDSEIFFKHFLTKYKKGNDFVEKLQEAMNDFYGKFAMVFYIDNDIYVVRGKTADLYITYMVESYKKDAPVLGFMVNTSRTTLEFITTLLSNLEQLEGKPPLFFTAPTILKEETIFRVNKLDLEEIGSIKENTYSYQQQNRGAGDPNFSSRELTTTITRNFTTGGAVTKQQEEEERLIRQLSEFASRYSLTINDVSDLFMAGYGISLEEMEVPILNHFFDKVLPLITKRSPKDERKTFKKVLDGIAVSRTEYIQSKRQFPWMLWTPEEKKRYLKSRENMTRIQ